MVYHENDFTLVATEFIKGNSAEQFASDLVFLERIGEYLGTLHTIPFNLNEKKA